MNSTWKRLLHAWNGKKYQIPNDRVMERYRYVKKHAGMFKDKKVLDLGCNAALYALPLLDYVERYIGIEGTAKYYNQAEKTKEILGDKVVVVRARIEELDLGAIDCNALIVSRILYYLDDVTLDRIQRELLPKCDVVLMINGTRPKQQKRNSWEFWHRDNGIKFLENFGMEIDMGDERASYRIMASR